MYLNHSLTSMCVYLLWQPILSSSYTNLPVPSHRTIQQDLVACSSSSSQSSSSSSIVGSKQWIGAVELQMVLQHRYCIESRILHVPSGADVSSKARDIYKHFKSEGTPVMIGGGHLAYGLLGIDWNVTEKKSKYLILDPHYTGSDDNVSKILKNGWCGWKDASDVFKADNFYNFLLPQRPRVI
mmetsp:Transcript_12396/g.20557  ORF Transcript_12396/g.20557 Transcript_12396/m.20557 type:complete len:183 (-) Transcript_12396:99-647(-)